MLFVQYFRQGDDHLENMAQFYRGLFESGDGVAIHKALAMHYFKLAANSGMA
jgi:TPR repeat protein